jgi:c-di-GMP-binding flagellar brake protein YcgR
MDRRIKSRIDVQLTCYVGAGTVQAEPVRAFTENVSRTGILMRWVEGVPFPEIEKKLTLDLKLPENSEFGPRVMRCRAEVLRVTRCNDNSPAVALKILSMRVVKGKHASKERDLASMPLAVDRVI